MDEKLGLNQQSINEDTLVEIVKPTLIIEKVMDYGDGAIGVTFTVKAHGLEHQQMLYVTNDKKIALREITEFAEAKKKELLESRTLAEAAKDPTMTIADLENMSKEKKPSVFDLDGQEVEL